MSEKICCACKKPKPLDDFYKQSDQADGRGRKCKDCKREYSAKKGKEIRDQKWQFMF